MRRRTSRSPDATEALALLGAAGATLATAESLTGGRLAAPGALALRGAAGPPRATAESLTGGRLAAAVTAVPGASARYLGGLVTYATELKQSLLGVPVELVAQYGVVSAECARAMAEGC